MPEELDNEADLSAFMASVEEPYIEDPDRYNVQGLYNLKSSTLLPTEKAKGALNLAGRHSYDYIPQYLIKAAEEQIEKYYNPETQTLALPSTPEPLALPAPVKEVMAKPESKPYVFDPDWRNKPSTGPRFQRAYGMGETEPAAEKKTYQRNGQKITMEEIPLASAELTPAEKLKDAEARIAANMSNQPIPMNLITAPPMPPPTPPPIMNEELGAMLREIEQLKQEQERLTKIRDAKLERLKLKWHNIAASIKAKHPVITALIERAARAAPVVGKAAVSAGKSFAKGLGNLAAKIADPYARQEFVNSLDYATRDFAPEGYYQNPIDRINRIRYTPPTQAPPQPGMPQRPMPPSDNELEKEAERLRLNRSIIRQRAQLANQQAQIQGKPLPYPNVPIISAGDSTRRRRSKSLREVLSQLERVKLENELNREKKLATA